MAIVAVTPAFNEETSIGSVIARTRQHVDKVLTLDEGSADNTYSMAELMGATVLRHLKSVCKGMVLQTAFCFSGKNLRLCRNPYFDNKNNLDIPVKVMH
ncbi:MAG: hypothetical protein PWP14_1598 [Methanolobus sp.]|nr:hypothetical protein [Methanolobus sp.]